MKAGHFKRLRKLEKQYGEDHQQFYLSDLEKIYEDCPEIAAIKEQVLDYVIRQGPEPPRYFQYGENERSRRWLWTLHVDKKAQAMFHRLNGIVEVEAEKRGVQREKEAAENLLKNWEWQQGAPEREAKAAAEREERKRKMEEERLERERKWEEERAARLQQTNGQQPYGGPTNGWLRDG
jgi:hypothetical protein